MATLHSFQFGEILIQNLFSELKNSDKTVPIYVNNGNGKFEKKNYQWSKLMTEIASDYTGECKMTTEVGLKEYSGGGKFNSLHQIDVGIEFTVPSRTMEQVFGVEVKLGKTGGARSFPKTFNEEWNSVDVIFNKKNYAVGNMIAILEKLERGQNRISAGDKGNLEVTPGWALVLREDAMSGETVASTEFVNLKYIFVFEQIWEAAEDEIRSDVRKVLTDSFESTLRDLDQLTKSVKKK